MPPSCLRPAVSRPAPHPHPHPSTTAPTPRGAAPGPPQPSARVWCDRRSLRPWSADGSALPAGGGARRPPRPQPPRSQPPPWSPPATLAPRPTCPGARRRQKSASHMGRGCGPMGRSWGLWKRIQGNLALHPVPQFHGTGAGCRVVGVVVHVHVVGVPALQRVGPGGGGRGKVRCRPLLRCRRDGPHRRPHQRPHRRPPPSRSALRGGEGRARGGRGGRKPRQGCGSAVEARARRSRAAGGGGTGAALTGIRCRRHGGVGWGGVGRGGAGEVDAKSKYESNNGHDCEPRSAVLRLVSKYEYAYCTTRTRIFLCIEGIDPL